MPFAPLEQQPEKRRFVPLDSRPRYNYLEPEDGSEKENILFESTGETVSAPIGAGRVLSSLEADDLFESFKGDASVGEETSAVFEKQAAYVALVANAYGLVADSEINDFVADRSRALASAQARQPKYMKEFNRQFEESEGFFETAGVFLSNPRAIGRTAITNSPNSILPLITTWMGATAGAAAGAKTGAVVGGIGGNLTGVGAVLPEEVVTIPAGALVGGAIGTIAGGAAGAVPGGAIVEIGAEIDSMLQEQGVDITDPVSVLIALENDALMEDIKEKAERKGITTASVDGLVQIFGGRFLKGAKQRGAGAAEKAVAGTKDIAVQSIGEGAGEAAGQFAKDGEVSLKEAALEAVTGLAQSVGQTGIGATAGQVGAVKRKAGKVISDRKEKKAEEEKVVAREVETAETQLEDSEQAQKEIVQENIKEVDAAIKESGVSAESIDQEDKSILASAIEDIKAEVPGAEANLSSQVERIKKSKDNADALRVVKAAFKSGVKLAREDVAAAQTAVISSLEKAGLEGKDRAKFIRSIKNIQTKEQAIKNLPKIEKRLNALLDQRIRRDTVSSIKKIVKSAKKSKVIAVDFAKTIESVVAEIDTQKRTEKTKSKLLKTKEFIENNPRARIPKPVLKKLELLEKTPFEDVSTEQLQSMLKEISGLQKQGKVKLALKKKAVARRQKERLNELDGQVKPLVSREISKASVGERLSIMEEVKNKFASAANRAREISLALNPMDVFFDMIDGAKDYNGPTHKIFKQTIDKSFTKYLDLKESVTRDVKDLSTKLKLDGRNFERIGVFAAAQQKGGIDKLEASGISKEEVKRLVLTKPEMQVYSLMRERLDSMFPAINETMVDIYNKNVDQVEDYFPFMTDFDALNDLEIQDMVGDNLPSPDGKKKDVEKGFTKSRVGGKNAIKLDAMAVFLQHVDNATYLVEMSKDIKELGNLAQSNRFEEIAGDTGQKFIVDWIDLLARKGRAPNRVGALDTLRVNTGAAILGYKLSTILIQPTALLDGAALVGGNYVSRGVNSVATSKRWRKFLVENFPELRERVGDDPAYIEMGGESTISKVRETGFAALKHVDMLTASSVVAGAYIKAIESRGQTVDLTKANPAAIQEAQLLMRRTQSSAFAKDTPQIISAGKLTGNASLDKLIFQFQSFMLNRWSIIKHDIAVAGIGGKRTAQAVNAATFLLLAGVAELGIRRGGKEIIAALTGDDLEPWEDTIEKEAVGTLVSNVPIISNIIGSLEFGSNPVPSISLVDNVIKKANLASKSKDPGKKIKHSVGAAALGAGAAFGIPGTLQAEQLLRGALSDGDKKRF